MVKSYLKFEPSKTFGLVASPSSNAIWIPDEELPTSTSLTTSKPTGSGRAVVAANEDVLVWDIKRGELLSRWSDSDNKSEVTCIARSEADPDIFAVGYDDGKIRLWDSRLGNVIISFNGHRGAVTRLAFDEGGVRLASGGRDTDVIVWDLVAEVGLFKLRGHKDQITSIHFLKVREGRGQDTDGDAGVVVERTKEYLLTTSKDALIKVWDLELQHCVETHVAQSNGECWSLGLAPDHSGCVTAGNDGELRAWSINGAALFDSPDEKPDLKAQKILKDRGTFYRHGKDRTIGVYFHPKSEYIAVYGAEKAVEIWRIRSESEIQKSLARKRKRRREKAAGVTGEDKENDEVEAPEDKPTDVSEALITEVFVPFVIVRTGGKVRSMDWAGGKSRKSIQILVATTNNQVELYSVASVERKKLKGEEQPDYSRTLSVDMPGHRSDIRTLALSSDDRMLASASQGSLKIWNIRTQSCIRTLDCGYALCSAFLPGDKIVVVGTRSGTLEVFDIASSTLLDTIEAHDKDIWSLQVHPDGKSLVSGSADKSAKFWTFKVIQEEILGTKRTTPKLTLIHTRTLKVSDDILSLRFSPDARLLAIGLMDNTVKVFFVDSLKLFLNLYGHKLPVLSMDISYDSKLIVTSSADKNIRIWGLDFGDCHRALFAHQDSIMSVAFVPTNADGNGHHFFSASKDRLLKYFDGDKFEQIQKLAGHHGEIWAMAVSHRGDFFVSASHDKSIRVWQQSDEQIFLEEEREKELEDLYETTLLTSLDRNDDADADADVADTSKQTTQTLMAGEKISEALTLGIEDLATMDTYATQKALNPSSSIAPPPRHPLYLANNNISATHHLLSVLRSVPAASLTDALLTLPFTQLPALLTFLVRFADAELDVPLTCRVLFFMLGLHHRQIIAGKIMRPLLEDVRGKLRGVLGRRKDEMGFNLAALTVVGRGVEEKTDGGGFVDESWEDVVEKRKGKGKGRKRGFVSVA